MVQLLIVRLTTTINGSSLFTLFSCSGSLLFLLYELCPDLHPHLGSTTLSWMQEAVRKQKAIWK